MLNASQPVAVGDKAPDFTLSTQDGRSVRLGDFAAKGPVVIFFYPKDDTMGCTAEVCSFRDNFDEFVQLGASVVGISSDDIDSHASFARKHTLQFPLLSDAGGKVRKLYGVPTTLGLFPGRVTYVVDAAGVVRHIFNSQIAARAHVTEALSALRAVKNP